MYSKYCIIFLSVFLLKIVDEKSIRPILVMTMLKKQTKMINDDGDDTKDVFNDFISPCFFKEIIAFFCSLVWINENK